jgi:hypothetical protein
LIFIYLIFLKGGINCLLCIGMTCTQCATRNDFLFFDGYDSYGGDITYKSGTTLNDCINFCLSDSTCLAFNRLSSGGCWFK